MKKLIVVIPITVTVAIIIALALWNGYHGGSTFTLCENGFVQSANKCVPDPKILKDISIDELADNFCPNNMVTQNQTGTFLTCLHEIDDSKETVFDLPLPVYLLNLCTSMHGCMYQYMWTSQIPPNLISEEQKQQAIDKALQLPETKNWPAKPNLNHFLISSSSDKWIANIEFFIDGVKMPQHNKCEYYDSVNVDLETLEITNGFRNFTNFERCYG